MKLAIMSDFTRVFYTQVLPSFVNLNDKPSVLSFNLTCYKYFVYLCLPESTYRPHVYTYAGPTWRNPIPASLSNNLIFVVYFENKGTTPRHLMTSPQQITRSVPSPRTNAGGQVVLSRNENIINENKVVIAEHKKMKKVVMLTKFSILAVNTYHLWRQSC